MGTSEAAMKQALIMEGVRAILALAAEVGGRKMRRAAAWFGEVIDEYADVAVIRRWFLEAAENVQGLRLPATEVRELAELFSEVREFFARIATTRRGRVVAALKALLNLATAYAVAGGGGQSFRRVIASFSGLQEEYRDLADIEARIAVAAQAGEGMDFTAPEVREVVEFFKEIGELLDRD